MTGWKTKAAGVAAIATGVGMLIPQIVKLISGEPVDGDQIYKAWGTIVGGLAILGIGHKIEKTRG